MKRLLVLGFVMLALAATGCARGAARPEDDGTPSGSGAPAGSETFAVGPVVVCSLFAPYDFARAVARGTGADVQMLMDPGVDNHAFDPTPADMARIGRAGLFVYVGGESEAWVEKVLAASGGGVRPLRLLDAVDALDEELAPGMESGEDGGTDEHIWTSPVNAMKMAGAIADALVGLDPANAAAYRANLADYLAELDALDRAFEEAVGSGARREIVFGDRFPFLYFAKRYALTYYAAFPGCGRETEPSAKTLAFLIGKVRQDHIPVVYHIEQGNERVARAIASETGAEVMRLHSCHTVSRDEFEAGETYLSLMRGNVEALKVGLS